MNQQQMHQQQMQALFNQRRFACTAGWMDTGIPVVTELPKEYPPIKESGLFTEVKNDVTKFVSEYRYVFYFIALALIVDQFIFRGVFRDRLQRMTETLIDKVEQKVSGG